MITEVRKADGNLIVLDAGDLLFESHVTPDLPPIQQQEALLNAQLIVDAFNIMGCDAVGIGDDDLALGPKAFVGIAKKASVPFISSNLVFKGSRKVSVPYVIKEAGGLRWGIFSLASAHPSSTPHPREWKTLDPLEKGRAVVKELKEKADLVILLADMPLEELKELLSQLQGVTIAVASHNPSGRQRSLQFGETLVVGDYGWGRYLGRLDIRFKDPSKPCVDETTIETVENDLAAVKKKIQEGATGSFEELKTQMEAQLTDLKGGNICRNELIPLTYRFKEDSKVKKLVEEFMKKQKQMRKECP